MDKNALQHICCSLYTVIFKFISILLSCGEALSDAVDSLAQENFQGANL